MNVQARTSYLMHKNWESNWATKSTEGDLKHPLMAPTVAMTT